MSQKACVALLNSLFLKLNPPLRARTLPVYGSITTTAPFTLGSCLKLNLLSFIFSEYIISPTLNISSKFLVQSIDENSIKPSFLSDVSISIENRFTFLTIDNFHPIESSNLNFLVFSIQFKLFFVFNNGPLQPFSCQIQLNPFLMIEWLVLVV